jgi:hypothetical protein
MVSAPATEGTPRDAVRVRRTSDGTLTYAVAVPPQRLPAVAPDRLLAAWQAARRGAALLHWGPPRRMVFAAATNAPGLPGPTEIAIADADAGCWAEAVDGEVGLDTLPGLALCLRLLALIDVLTRAPWLAGLFDVTPEGIELHPALLRAAATMPLDGAARLDEAGLRRLLSRLPAAAAPRPRPIA